jgi:hypothetical protein
MSVRLRTQPVVHVLAQQPANWRRNIPEGSESAPSLAAKFIEQLFISVSSSSVRQWWV